MVHCIRTFELDSSTIKILVLHSCFDQEIDGQLVLTIYLSTEHLSCVLSFPKLHLFNMNIPLSYGQVIPHHQEQILRAYSLFRTQHFASK